MPTVFQLQGFRFFFYSNEGDPREPVHIHVRKSGYEAKLWIEPVGLASNDGFDAKTLRALAKMVEDNKLLIERAWNEHFS